MRFEATQGIDAVKMTQFLKAKHNYDTVCGGDDPETGKQIYVDCVVGGQTVRMNAGRNAAETFDKGLRLAQINNELMTFVVDFYNVILQNIPIMTAFAINLQQALDARTHYVEYQIMKGQLAAATTVTEVRAVDLTFSVNTE